MIVGQDIHPERQLYYWGGIVIRTLQSFSVQEIDYFVVYEELKKTYNISVEVFSLTLDWLFIVGAIENKQGRISKCF